MTKIGFIGSGNMGSALARAVSRVSDTDVYVYDKDTERAVALADEIGASSSSLEEIANPAGYMVQSIHLVADNYNYANATFEILYGTMSQSHDGTTGMMRPTTISYTVIA